MDKLRYYVYLFLTYFMTFGLLFYIGGPKFWEAASFTLIFGCIFLIMSIFRILQDLRGVAFTVISIVAVGLAAGKFTSTFMDGGISGVFAALLYIYLLKSYIWDMSKTETSKPKS